MRPEGERRLIAYIHNNPVRAGVVSRARDCSWTSHQMYVRSRLAPSWLHIDEGLALCGVELSAFDSWVADDMATGETPDLLAISRAARKRGALHVATPTVSPTDVPLVARPFARIRPDPREVVDVVAQVCCVPAAAFTSRRPEQALVEARRIAVHAAKLLGLTGSEIAAALGVGRQTASRLGGSECTPGQRAVLEVVLRSFARCSPTDATRDVGGAALQTPKT
jgi:hypothetical protein